MGGGSLRWMDNLPFVWNTEIGRDTPIRDAILRNFLKGHMGKEEGGHLKPPSVDTIESISFYEDCVCGHSIYSHGEDGICHYAGCKCNYYFPPSRRE